MQDIFFKIEDHLTEIDTDFQKDDLRSFIPKSSSSYQDVLGEWLRLWNSYQEGLFTYEVLDKSIKTNNRIEQAFGQQKSHFYSRSAKKQVGRLILTEGDYHLRFRFCSDEELESDIWEEACRFNWRLLRSCHSKRKNKLNKQWVKKMGSYLGVEAIQEFYYHNRLT